MAALTDELRKEHAAVGALLQEIKQKGIGSPEARNKLVLAKRGLLGHLQKEDERLYPVLHKAAATDDALKRMLNQFAADMKDISAAALAFFEKYAAGGDDIEFAKDFGRLSYALSMRIKKEETILYPAFERVAN